VNSGNAEESVSTSDSKGIHRGFSVSCAVGDMWRVNKAPHSTFFLVNRKLKIQSLMKIWVSCDVICFAFFVLVAGDDDILLPLFPNAARALDKNICGTARTSKTR